MIEAHTKLIEENKKLKASLLQKMFPKKGEKVPEIRLKVFSGNWKVKTLNELYKFYRGKSLSKEDITINGKPCLLYGELFTIYAETIDFVYSRTNKD